MFKTNEAGYSYDVQNIDSGSQTILFIKKEPDANKNLITVQDGTTNEAIIAVLIDRINFLDAKFPSGYNAIARDHLQIALNALNERTTDRTSRGVEGKNLI